MTTVYEKLINQRDNFITAAIQAESDFMKAVWLNRAENVSKKINDVSLNDASMELE